MCSKLKWESSARFLICYPVKWIACRRYVAVLWLFSTGGLNFKPFLRTSERKGIRLKIRDPNQALVRAAYAAKRGVSMSVDTLLSSQGLCGPSCLDRMHAIQLQMLCRGREGLSLALLCLALQVHLQHLSRSALWEASCRGLTASFASQFKSTYTK